MLRRVALAALFLALASAAFPQDWSDGRDRFRRHDRHHFQLRIGGSHTIAQGETVAGPVVLIGGTNRIDGHVEDDVVLVGGDVEIGPGAEIDGDLVRIGGNATVDPSARIYGEVNHADVDWPRVRFRWPWAGEWWTRTVAFGATVARLTLTLFGGLLLTLLAPGWLEPIARRVADMPGVSAAVGLAAEMIAGPALVILVIALIISIVGIPLLAGIPILLAVLAVTWVAGFTATAARIGASIRGRQAGVLAPRAGDFLIGFLMLTAVTFVGRALALGPDWMAPIASVIIRTGLFIEYCAWTLGLGAAIGSMFAARHHTPPPIPPLPASAS